MVILVGMTHRVGPKGQVVIPKPLRDALGLRPGDGVVFAQDGDAVTVRREAAVRPLLGRFRDAGLVADLEADRAAAAQREQGRIRTGDGARPRVPR